MMRTNNNQIIDLSLKELQKEVDANKTEIKRLNSVCNIQDNLIKHLVDLCSKFEKMFELTDDYIDIHRPIKNNNGKS